jgi:hypothetical protein
MFIFYNKTVIKSSLLGKKPETVKRSDAVRTGYSNTHGFCGHLVVSVARYVVRYAAQLTVLYRSLTPSALCAER